MSKFKGSGDLTRTMILGTLANGQKHGYEIKKKLMEELGESADINFGSIYYGLKSLQDKGLLDHIRNEPGKGSPERSIYRITGKGRRALAELVENCLNDQRQPLMSLEVGLNFKDVLPGDKVKQILEERFQQMNQLYQEDLDDSGDGGGDGKIPRLIREYRLYKLGAEVHFLKNILSLL